MKVLLAEDSLTMRRLLASQLQRWNYEITEVEDGEAAWEAFQRESFELVLTDWVMPKVDGLELTRRIRACDRQQYVYIVLLTARSENEDLVEAMEAGADDFLGKPCNPKELRVRLRAGERIIDLEHTLVKKNQKLLKTQAALIETEKLAGVGQLAAGMAHEINNPIAFVTNNLAVLQRDTQSLMDLVEAYSESLTVIESADPQLAASLRKQTELCDLPWLHENLPQLFQSSRDGVARVREIVNNLRDFAHLDEAETDNMDVASAINSTLQILTPEFESRQVTICSRCDPGLIIQGKPAKMKQVFHSILLNAAQASEPGQEIQITASQKQSSVCVSVTDHGRGIDDETRQHLFEPFYTTREVGTGKGLGLAVSWGVVRQHGGTIEVKSAPGEGTTFLVMLPLSQIV